MKTVLVGCGKIADAHVACLTRLRHLTQLTAVCDREPAMSEQLALRFGVPRHYADVERMLEVERPDVVHVTTPPRSHLALARRAFGVGAHVYLEKPMTPSLEEDRALLADARACARKLTVGYTYHFDPGVERLRTLLAEGRIGDVVHVESVYTYDLGGDYGTAARRDPGHWVNGLVGGIARNNLDHPLIDVAEWLDASEPRVDALVRRDASSGGEEVRAALTGHDATGSVVFSCRARPATHRLTVFGTRDTATVDFSTRAVTLESRGLVRSAPGRALGPFLRGAEQARLGIENLLALTHGRFGFFEGMLELMRRFYESVATGDAPPIAEERLAWVSAVAHRIFARSDALRREESSWP